MIINEDFKTKLLLEINLSFNEIEEIKYQLNAKIKMRRPKAIYKNLLKLKQGRKKKDDPTITNHNKYSSDNIVKNIKKKINDSLIYFVNRIINTVYENNKDELIKILVECNLSKDKKSNKFIEVIKKIDYKTIANKTNKEYNLKLLCMTIKEYLSISISEKYKNFESDYNKIIIEKLLEDEENRPIFNFLFNKIKIEDWLDIFIYKKDLEIPNDDGLLNDLHINIIKNSIKRIDDSLIKICLEDRLFYHCFMLILYNYKRFFLMKEGRKEKKI